MDNAVESRNERRAIPVRIDDFSWAERSEYWFKTVFPKSKRFVARAGVRKPLILTGHGVSLRVEKDSLLVRDGFTHYPQQHETWRFFPGEWRLPSRIVVVDVDGGLSFAALAWLSDHNIPLIQINWRGEVINVVSGRPEIIIPERLKSQLKATNKSGRIEIALKLIQTKLANSIDTLRHVFPKSEIVGLAIDKLDIKSKRLKRSPPSAISTLMGVEGTIGQVYFSAWRDSKIKWKNIEQHPIPEDWHYFRRRASQIGNKFRPNRNATHPINAMINYAYAILESQVRMQVVAAGLDPRIGILHGRHRDKHGLVFDLMEPLRPIADRKVLEFALSRTFDPADFTITNDGVCRLNPELARNLVRVVTASRHGNDTAARLGTQIAPN